MPAMPSRSSTPSPTCSSSTTPRTTKVRPAARSSRPRRSPRGSFDDDGSPVPVAGLLMLSGSLLEAPPDSQVMLTGAVCITLRQAGSASPGPKAGPNALLAGPGGSTPVGAGPANSASTANSGWWSWIIRIVLGK